jgi:hypothetical protein
MARRVVLLSVLAAAIVAVVGAGSAQAKLDSSFGEGGILYVKPPVPNGWQSQQIIAVATGGDGQAFVVDRQFPLCGPNLGCGSGTGDFVFNYLGSGALNASFAGSRGYEIPPSGVVSEPLITVSSSGLPIVAHETPVSGEGPGSILLQRLLTSGAPDPTFGTSGATSFPCACNYGNTQLLPGPEGSTMVVVTEEIFPGSGEAGTATVYKLNASGLPAKKFGSDGSINVRIPGQGVLDYRALAPGGATYFGGVGQSPSTDQGTLTKVSASGKVDKKYTRTATASLVRLLTGDDRQLKVEVAVAAKDGTVELFGSTGESGGFELKLRASGKLESKFGKNGVRFLGRKIVAAVGGSEGTTMALAKGTSLRVVRILAGGGMDPAFGKSGEELPGLSGSGITLSPAGKGKVSVVDLDLEECRFACGQISPKVYRFLEG